MFSCLLCICCLFLCVCVCFCVLLQEITFDQPLLNRVLSQDFTRKCSTLPLGNTLNSEQPKLSSTSSEWDSPCAIQMIGLLRRTRLNAALALSLKSPHPPTTTTTFKLRPDLPISSVSFIADAVNHTAWHKFQTSIRTENLGPPARRHLSHGGMAP